MCGWAIPLFSHVLFGRVSTDCGVGQQDACQWSCESLIDGPASPRVSFDVTVNESFPASVNTHRAHGLPK